MKKVLEIANQWKGKDENKDNAELSDFLGINPVQTPWCAHFVRAVLSEAGYNTDSVGGRANDMKSWGIECQPTPGCVVVFRAHVGFLDEDITKVLGGNQSDGVYSHPIEWYGEPVAYRTAQVINEPDINLVEEPEDAPDIHLDAPDDSEIARSIANFEKGVFAKFDKHEKLIAEVNERMAFKLNHIDQRLDSLDKRIARIEDYLSQFSTED